MKRGFWKLKTRTGRSRERVGKVVEKVLSPHSPGLYIIFPHENLMKTTNRGGRERRRGAF